MPDVVGTAPYLPPSDTDRLEFLLAHPDLVWRQEFAGEVRWCAHKRVRMGGRLRDAIDMLTGVSYTAYELVGTFVDGREAIDCAMRAWDEPLEVPAVEIEPPELEEAEHA